MDYYENPDRKTVNREISKENSRKIIDKLNAGAEERKRKKRKAFQKDTRLKV